MRKYQWRLSSIILGFVSLLLITIGINIYRHMRVPVNVSTIPTTTLVTDEDDIVDEIAHNKKIAVLISYDNASSTSLGIQNNLRSTGDVITANPNIVVIEKTAQKDLQITAALSHPPPLSSDSTLIDTVLLIMASNRPEYLKRSLDYIIRYHPHHNYGIIISEDGRNTLVQTVIRSATSSFYNDPANTGIPFIHINHPACDQPAQNGYYKLSRHFKYALNEVFSNHEAYGFTVTIQRVLIVEEDLEIASDFFEYFTAVSPMLDKDESLLCASAWNDNGLTNKIHDEKQLMRSDFFPGLGWMLSRRVWLELAPKWPEAYWDDWMREPAQRKGRHIIRPEVCRTLHYGSHGVSNAQFNNFLNSIQLNTIFVKFTEINLSYLSQEIWDAYYLNPIRNIPSVTVDTFQRELAMGTREMKITYSDFNDYVIKAQWAGIMGDVKAGVPRGAYKGVVTCYNEGVKLHLVPSDFIR